MNVFELEIIDTANDTEHDKTLKNLFCLFKAK